MVAKVASEEIGLRVGVQGLEQAAAKGALEHITGETLAEHAQAAFDQLMHTGRIGHPVLLPNGLLNVGASPVAARGQIHEATAKSQVDADSLLLCIGPDPVEAVVGGAVPEQHRPVHARALRSAGDAQPRRSRSGIDLTRALSG